MRLLFEVSKDETLYISHMSQLMLQVLFVNAVIFVIVHLFFSLNHHCVGNELVCEFFEEVFEIFVVLFFSNVLDLVFYFASYGFIEDSALNEVCVTCVEVS